MRANAGAATTEPADKHTLSEKKVRKCTFKGTMACHWGGTLKGTGIVPSTVGTYLYPWHLYLIKTRIVPLVTDLYPLRKNKKKDPFNSSVHPLSTPV